MKDRIFSGLEAHFNKSIYLSLKGQVRLAVIQRDLNEWIDSAREKNVTDAAPMALDIGGGQGQMSYWLAGNGFSVDYLEPALELRQTFERQLSSEINIRVHDASLQTFIWQKSYDWVVCHAVLEWTSDPYGLLRSILGRLPVGGTLSLAYFNELSLRFRHLLWGNFHRSNEEKIGGDGKSMTPTHPMLFSEVKHILSEYGCDVVLKSGCRVFIDYMDKHHVDRHEKQTLLDNELHWSRCEEFFPVARYHHLVIVKRTEVEL